MIKANEMKAGPAERMVDKGCAATEFWTPERILVPMRRYFALMGYAHGIELDPATDASNPTRASRFFTERDDGLKQPWLGIAGPAHVFCNPPYGERIRFWVEKISAEAGHGNQIVALLPGQRFEQDYWQRALFTARLSALVAVSGRVGFLGRVCDRCGQLESKVGHMGGDAKEPPCEFRWGGKTRVADGNPYGSFLYVFNGQWEAVVEAFQPIGMCLEPGRVAQREAAMPLFDDGGAS